MPRSDAAAFSRARSAKLVYQPEVIKANLFFVRPGGTEQEFSLPFELPGVPQSGDYVTIIRPQPIGISSFIVRRCWWNLAYPESPDVTFGDEGPVGTFRELWVECEYARGPFSSEEHNNDSGPDAKFLQAGPQFPSYEV